MNPAQIAEALEVTPPSLEAEAAAARILARHALGKEDLVLLLDALGLPRDDDTLTNLFPLIPETGASAPMTDTPPALTETVTATAPAADDAPATASRGMSAFEAMALSMHSNGDTEQAIQEATGLSATELSTLLAESAPGLPGPAADVPVILPAVSNQIQNLLDWAATHPAASVRSRAARIAADLSELADRRDSEAAQREAEEKVAKAKAELEKARAQLHAVRAGKASTRPPAAAAAAPAPIRTGLGSGRSREELAAIRTWARAHGHQVADAGMVRKAVLEAYDAARQTVRKAS
nr:Lsr2 family protein [Streptomyces sp. SID8380]